MAETQEALTLTSQERMVMRHFYQEGQCDGSYLAQLALVAKGLLGQATTRNGYGTRLFLNQRGLAWCEKHLRNARKGRV